MDLVRVPDQRLTGTFKTIRRQTDCSRRAENNGDRLSAPADSSPERFSGFCKRSSFKRLFKQKRKASLLIQKQKKILQLPIWKKLGITQLAGQCYRELSGGQQQRVLIARALCATRELLILDEPITGLDPMAIQDFYSMIRKLNREDKVAIIMVSHDLRNAVEEANKNPASSETGTFLRPGP